MGLEWNSIGKLFSMSLLCGRVIDYSSGVSMGFAGGQAEVVDALWAMRGWRAAPTRRKKYPGVLGWWYHPCCYCSRDTGTSGILLPLFPDLKIISYSLSNLSGVPVIDTRRFDPALMHRRTSLPIDGKPSSLWAHLSVTSNHPSNWRSTITLTNCTIYWLTSHPYGFNLFLENSTHI